MNKNFELLNAKLSSLLTSTHTYKECLVSMWIQFIYGLQIGCILGTQVNVTSMTLRILK